MSHCTVFILGGATYSNMSARILNPLVTVDRSPVFDVIRRVIPIEVLLNVHRHYSEDVVEVAHKPR
jgi:hypothetical protein